MEITAALLETVEDFNDAIEDYISFTGELGGKLLTTAEVDPDFARGYFF